MMFVEFFIMKSLLGGALHNYDSVKKIVDALVNDQLRTIFWVQIK